MYIVQVSLDFFFLFHSRHSSVETKSLYFLQKNILNVLAIMTVMCRLIGQLMSVNSLNRLEDVKIFSREFFIIYT